MKLKLSYDKQEDIPSGFADLYTEQGGKWVLTGVEGMKTQTDIDRVNEALRKERSDHTATKEKFKPFADMDPEDVLAKLDKFPELEAAAAGKIDDTKINEMVETRIKTRMAPVERALAKANADLSERDKAIDSYKGKDRTRAIHDSVRAAATSAKLRGEAVDDVLMLAERVFDVDESGSVISKDGVGVTPGIDPTVWLTEMQPKRPHWWGDSSGGGAKGGGGGGNGGNNPFSAQHWNLTEQGRVLTENRQRAEQLAKSAGTTIGGPRPAMPR